MKFQPICDSIYDNGVHYILDHRGVVPTVIIKQTQLARARDIGWVIDKQDNIYVRGYPAKVTL